MTFTTAVAAGAEAADSLLALCRAEVRSGGVRLERSEEYVIAWAARCPWIDTHDSGGVLVVLDGRLHNLSSTTAGQAELLWQRYRANGLDVARRLLGDFVLIILDRPARTVVVSRDPVGVRPWYQAAADRRYAGASDIGTLASLPWVDTTVNERIAIEYLAAVEESRGETILVGIQTLRPGRTWHCRDGSTRTFPHHRWELEPELDLSWDDATERCRAVFDEAVRCRLDLTQQPASELSGGLDSSSVVGTAVRLGRDDLLVGRLVFDGPRADERFYSDAVIDHWGLRAVSAPPWMPDDESWDLIREFKRPSPDPNFTMFISLHRLLLAEGRLEGLTGLGGDDAFVASGIGPRVVSAVKLRQGDILRTLVGWTFRNVRRAWPELAKPTLGYMAAPWRPGRWPGWITSTAASQADLLQVFHRRAERVTGIDAIDGRLANFTSGYDASILETRTVIADSVGRRDTHPFLDPRVVNATYGLDPWWPTKGGHSRALQLEAFRDRLPPAVTERRSKAEFSEIFWPQVLDRRTLEAVRGGPLAALGWLDFDGFDALVAKAKKGMANAAIPLFRCVSLSQWLPAC